MIQRDKGLGLGVLLDTGRALSENHDILYEVESKAD